MKFAQTCDANFAVRPLAVDEERGAFAMEFLPSSTHPVWKGMLLSGMVDPSLAQELGVRLARIHSASAQAQGLAEAFDTDDLFHALRLEPFFLATGDVHPGIRAHLAELASRTARTKLVLVHGDVSPKNILVGPRGPVLLDAECAWWGDPAFDAALFLTHLLLKCLAAPQSLSSLIQACADFADVYAAGVAWERREGCMARVTALIPALLLARVDGRSPVEYLPLDSQRLHVRSMALRLFEQPMPLPDVFLEWESRLKYSA
jgi:aminoglycoside phosphotransferase (APT) family kinase protein